MKEQREERVGEEAESLSMKGSRNIKQKKDIKYPAVTCDVSIFLFLHPPARTRFIGRLVIKAGFTMANLISLSAHEEPLETLCGAFGPGAMTFTWLQSINAAFLNWWSTAHGIFLWGFKVLFIEEMLSFYFAGHSIQLNQFRNLFTRGLNDWG